MKRFAEEAVDVTTFMPEDYLLEQYNQDWIDMATASDGKVIGVWGRVIVKSLVWYNPLMFEESGYEVPTTFEELIELSDQIAADGGFPWYAPMESGVTTGWVATDWIEDFMLRTTSLENYDRWTMPASAEDRLPFSSPEVKGAWEIMGSFLKNRDYMYGGLDAILDNRFFDAGIPLVEGEAFMVKMGSFLPGWLFDIYPDLEIGPDGNLNYFYLPAIDEEYGNPVLVSGDAYTMFNDRPEVRAVMEHLTRAASLRPGIEAGIFLSSHNDAEVDWYREFEKGMAEILSTADSVRFDGSDLQPADVGAEAFLQGIVDYVSDAKDLDTILEEIDAAWPESYWR
jgi:alpha-glucoside transport system substrate-binding protein